MTRTILAVGVLAVAGLGCKSTKGPLESRRTDRADAPGYTIEEQQRRGRERNTVPDDNFRVGPPTYLEGPDPVGIGNSPAGQTRTR